MNRFMFAALLCAFTLVAQVPEGGGGGGGTGAAGPPGPAFEINTQTLTAVKDDAADVLPIYSANEAGTRQITLANILKGLNLLNMAMTYTTPPSWATPGTVPTGHRGGHKVEFGGAFPTAALSKNYIATGIGGYLTVPSTSAFAGGAAGLTGQFSGGSAATFGTGVMGAAYPATGNTAGVKGARGLGESCTESRATGSIACPGSTIANLAQVVGGEFGTNNDSTTTASRYSLVLTTGGTQPGVLDAALGIPVVPAGVRKHVYGVRFDAGSVDFAMRVGPIDTGSNTASAAIRLVSVDGSAVERTGAIDQTAAGIMRFLVPAGLSAQISDGTAILSLPPAVMQTGVPLFATGTPTMLATTGTGDLVRAASPTITGTGTAALGALTVTTGTADFSGAGFLRVPTTTVAAASTDCDEASEVGRIRLRSTDPATANGGARICQQNGASSYGWSPASYKTGTTAPATCAAGDLFVDTDATPAGRQVYVCSSSNTWTLAGDGGGGGTVASTTSTLKGDGAGNAVAVTGTATDCVKVNGSSGACGTGAGGGGNPFSMTVDTGADTVTLTALRDVTFQRGRELTTVLTGETFTYDTPTGTGDFNIYYTGTMVLSSLALSGVGTATTSSRPVGTNANATTGLELPQGAIPLYSGTVTTSNFVATSTSIWSGDSAPYILDAGANVTLTAVGTDTLQIASAAGGGGGVTDGDKGDITISGSGTVYTVDAAAITTAKIGAASVTADKQGSAVNAQTGTTYTFLDSDRGKLVTTTNAAAIAGTLPQAGAAGNFSSTWFADVQNRGAGTFTITPTTSTIDGAATLALTTGQGVSIWSDGTNYFTMRGIGGSGGSGTPAGSGSEIQYRSDATTFGAISGTSVSGADVTFNGLLKAGASQKVELGANATRGYVKLFDNFANAMYMRGFDSAISQGAIVEFSTNLADSGVQIFPKGAIRLFGTATQPTCAVGLRGMIWPVQGSAGAADRLDMCMKGTADTYAWRIIFTAP